MAEGGKMMSRTYWAERADEEVRKGREYINSRPDLQGNSSDSVLCLDISKSMEGDAFDSMIRTAKTFIYGIMSVAQRLNHEENISIVTFGHETKIASHLCKDYPKLIQALDELHADGPSPMEGGLLLSVASLTAKPFHNLQGYNIRPKIILMTDGVATPGVIISGEDNQYIESEQVKRRIMTEIQAAATCISSRQYTIYCIPFGVSDQTYFDICTGYTGGKIIQANEIKRLVHMTSNCISATNVKNFHCLPGEDWKSIMQQHLGDTLSEKDFDYVVQKAEEATSVNSATKPSYEEFDINMPPIGKRVRRGPDWMYGDQDEFAVGTIIGHDEKKWLWVQWDHGGINIYPYNDARGYNVVVVDEPRQLPQGKNIDVGACVVRGPSWKNGNEDGGPGNIGVCFRIENNMVSVKWENGVIGCYRFGKEDCFDIEISALSKLKSNQSDSTFENRHLSPDSSTKSEFEADAEPFTRFGFENTFTENAPDDINYSHSTSNQCFDLAETQVKTSVQTEEGEAEEAQETKTIETNTSVDNEKEFTWKYFKNETWTEFDSTTSKILEDEYLLKRKTKVIDLDNKRFRVTFCKTPMKIRNILTSEEFIVNREEINIPQEVRTMKKEMADLYKKSLSKGKEKVYNIRVMVVGPEGVGKTVLTRRLLKQYVDISERQSTNGIDVHIEKCGARISDGTWKFDKVELEKTNQFENRIVHVMQQKPSPQNDEATISPDDDATIEIENTIDHLTLSEEPTDLLAYETSSQETISPDQFHEQNGKMTEPGNFTNQNTNLSISEGTHKSLGKLPSDITTPKELEPEKKDEMLTLITEKFDKLEDFEEEVIGEISFWDFGGQIVFYSTHQTFLTPRAVYIVVIDISKALKGKINRPCFTDKTGVTLWNYEDYLLFWLKSIKAYGSEDKGKSIPPVLIVATHLDKLRVEISKTDVDDVEKALVDKVKNFKKDLFEVLKKHYLINLVKDFFAIDNTTQDDNLEKLRMDIYNVSKSQKHWGEEKPASWILLEKELLDQKKQNRIIISFEEFCHLNSQTQYPIRSEKELQLFLTFHHAVGNVVFFNEEGLNKNIILNPQWLIDAFKLIITSEEFVDLKEQKLLEQWEILNKSGILHPSLIESLWKQDQDNNKFHENQDHIIRVMVKLDIMTKADEFENFDSYFVPSMVKEVLSPDELAKITNNSFSTPYFCYKFDEKFLPPSVFHRLLAACIGKWPVSKRKTKYLLYCGCGIFNLTRNQSHRLLICSAGHLIQLKIYRYDKMEIPERCICEETRRFIEQKLENLMNRSELCLKSTPYIRCRNASFRTTDGLLKVEELTEMQEIVCHDHDGNLRPTHCVYSYNLLRCWYTDKSLRLQYDVDRVVAENYAKTENYRFENYDRIPSETELNRMAKKIGPKFQSLGRELGILDNDIQAIIANKPGDVLNQCFEVLKKWTEIKGENATLERLEKAIAKEDIDVNIIASALEDN